MDVKGQREKKGGVAHSLTGPTYPLDFATSVPNKHRSNVLVIILVTAKC
jgi:hypothetical protein